MTHESNQQPAWRKSLIEYGHHVGYGWWAVVIVLILGTVGTLQTALTVPTWGWLLIITAGSLVAPFIAFHNLRVEYDKTLSELNSKIRGYEDAAKPRMSLSVQNHEVVLANECDTSLTKVHVRYRSLLGIHPKHDDSFGSLNGAPMQVRFKSQSSPFDLVPRDHCVLNIAEIMTSGESNILHFHHAIDEGFCSLKGMSAPLGSYVVAIEAIAENHRPISIEVLISCRKNQIRIRVISESVNRKLEPWISGRKYREEMEAIRRIPRSASPATDSLPDSINSESTASE